MSIEENKTIIRRYLFGDPETGRTNRDVWPEIVDAERLAVIGTPGFPDTRGYDNLVKLVAQDKILESFEDLEVTVDDVIAEGDKVVVTWNMTGTAKQPYTHPLTGATVPVGKSIARTGVSIITLDNGKIIQERTLEDRLGLLGQLDLAPPVG